MPAFALRRPVLTLALMLAVSGGLAQGALAQVSPFTQSLAIAAAEDKTLAAFYAARNYMPLWTGAGDAALSVGAAASPVSPSGS